MSWLGVALLILIAWIILGSLKAVVGVVFWVGIIIILVAAIGTLTRYLNTRNK
jgi:hypothetical protein